MLLHLMSVKQNISNMSETPLHATQLTCILQDNGPMYVDFLAGKTRHRRQYGGGRGQLVAKACGLQKVKTPTVLDVTAGFGQDAFVLACLGCDVTMVERSPVMGELLADGLKRLYADDASDDLLLKLIQQDSIAYLQALTDQPDVIYLDPMYPDTKNTALNKKEMQLLRELVGDDLDAEQLLQLALQKAKKRVVVKRPRHGDLLGNKEPDVVFTGKSSRFDVFLA